MNIGNSWSVFFLEQIRSEQEDSGAYERIHVRATWGKLPYFGDNNCVTMDTMD
jgi:hypothetical protein